MAAECSPLRTCEVALVSLYLRGGENHERVDRRKWMALSSSLRRREASIETMSRIARQEGFHHEALVLDSQPIVNWAEKLVDAGKVLSALSPSYPERWLKSLSYSAPPVLWRTCTDAVRGDSHQSEVEESTASLAVVGSRRISSEVSQFAFELGRCAVENGMRLFSGNAVGSDTRAMLGGRFAHGRVIGILPHGIHRLDRVVEGVEYWSACAPDEEFSRASAMERNGLIYASSQFSVVIHARLREGGTWHGAVDAHRRRLTRLIVRQDESEAGNRALIALGAIPLIHSIDLMAAFDSKGTQPFLF